MKKYLLLLQAVFLLISNESFAGCRDSCGKELWESNNKLLATSTCFQNCFKCVNEKCKKAIMKDRCHNQCYKQAVKDKSLPEFDRFSGKPIAPGRPSTPVPGSGQ